MLNIILFGPPGSGKGTQAALLVEKFGLIHVSTGDLFRFEMKNDTELGLKAKDFISKGLLVPDEVTIGMLKNKLDKHPEAKGFIFDGFPRNIDQASALDQLLQDKDQKIVGLFALDVKDEEIISRLLNRGKTSGRTDDQDESIIKNRLSIYKGETAPVFEHYEQKDKAYQINGVGNIEEIQERLSSKVNSLL